MGIRSDGIRTAIAGAAGDVVGGHRAHPVWRQRLHVAVQHDVVALAAVPDRLRVVAVARVELLPDQRAADRGVVLDVRAVACIPVTGQDGGCRAGYGGDGETVARAPLLDAVHLGAREIQVQVVARRVG